MIDVFSICREVQLVYVNMKIWFTHRPPNERACRRRTYSTSDAAAPSGDCGADQIKLSTDSGVDVGEINLADMNPEDIRVIPFILKVSIIYRLIQPSS
jgi:hypothetical protein